MSTKVGIIAEGPIDYTLLPALLGRIERDRAAFAWPTGIDNLEEILRLRKRGDGGVWVKVKELVNYLSSTVTDHAFFVILLDHRTPHVQRKIKKLISGKPRFILAIAIEETEAWWLADRRNTLAWLGLQANPQRGPQEALRYWRNSYNAERDKAPKRTLDALTRIAPNLDEYYGEGNQQLALDFVEGYWDDDADLAAIEQQCRRGFSPFCKDATAAFKTELARQGRLVR